MPTAVKGGLVAGLVVVVGWILYTASQSGDKNKKMSVDIDRPDAEKSHLTEDIARGFSSETDIAAKSPAERAGRSSRPRPTRSATNRDSRTRSETPAAAPQPKRTSRSSRATTPPGPAGAAQPRVSPPALRPPSKPADNASPSSSAGPPALGPTPTARIADDLEKRGDAKPAGSAQPSGKPASSGDEVLVPRGPVTKVTQEPSAPKTPPPALRPPTEKPEAKSAAAQPQVASGRSHTIELGDTLIDIAIRYYDDESLWPLIKNANPGLDERRLIVGQSIIIPPKPVAAPKPRTGSVKAPGGALTYVVEEGDTLIRIARNVLKDGDRWREIYELNRDQLDSPDRIRVGMVLKLPSTQKKPAAP
ncbi:MAG: LysM peptidoglycan-binding domain-containing protein [Planctomycetota bacterium]|nr:MAG: LysM peptidoglycan-binding domain-containing protein [Planctomycetota bacterium]